jgi:pimeloyl-ACP methyl ester carboxylesterase
MLIALATPCAAQEIVMLPTRTGVTQPILIEQLPEKAVAVALLFPGAGGQLRLREEGGQIRFAPNNFLVRSRMEFVQRGVIAVIVDAPSDQQDAGMDDNFRLGDAHAADISAVIAELRKRFAGLPLFVVGTSRGTVSAASHARRFPDAIAGVVLTATVFLAGKQFGQQGLSGFDFASIRPPLLLVHHRQDACRYTPYHGAARLKGRYPLISVAGGLPAQSAPCQPLSEHGFLGREADTVEAIVNWILKKPYQNEIA